MLLWELFEIEEIEEIIRKYEDMLRQGIPLNAIQRKRLRQAKAFLARGKMRQG